MVCRGDGVVICLVHMIEREIELEGEREILARRIAVVCRKNGVVTCLF